jgi:hypothetical protein
MAFGGFPFFGFPLRRDPRPLGRAALTEERFRIPSVNNHAHQKYKANIA